MICCFKTFFINKKNTHKNNNTSKNSKTYYHNNSYSFISYM